MYNYKLFRDNKDLKIKAFKNVRSIKVYFLSYR